MQRPASGHEQLEIDRRYCCAALQTWQSVVELRLPLQIHTGHSMEQVSVEKVTIKSGHLRLEQ